MQIMYKYNAMSRIINRCFVIEHLKILCDFVYLSEIFSLVSVKETNDENDKIVYVILKLLIKEICRHAITRFYFVYIYLFFPVALDKFFNLIEINENGSITINYRITSLYFIFIFLRNLCGQSLSQIHEIKLRVYTRVQ